MFLRKKRKNTRQTQIPPYEKQRAYTYRSSQSDTDDISERGDETKSRESSKIKPKIKSLGTIALLLIVAAVIFYSTTLDSNASVTVKSGKQLLPRPSSAYIKKANEILSSNAFNKSKLTIDKQEISQKMEAAFPELESVYIATPPWAHQPVFNLTLHKPALIFLSGGNRYVINEEGMVMFEEGDSEIDLSRLSVPLISDETAHEVRLGEPALSSDQVNYIREVVFQLGEKQLPIEKVFLKPGGDELHVKLKKFDYLVKFSFYHDARSSAGAFFATKKKLDSEGKTPQQYIDVRVENRSYVK